MMKRNSIVILLVAAVMALAGCKKDSLNGDGISATIQRYDAGKVYLDNANYSVWHEGDQVLINTFQASVFDEGGNHWKVNFGGNSVETGSMIYALFPYNAAFSITGTTASLALPAQQTYAVDAQGQQLINAPMAAKGTTELAFYNLCALLKVQVPAGIYVNEIKVTTTEGDAVLAGDATVDYSGNVPVLTMASTGDDMVTLTVENSRADGIYYVCVPPVANKTFKVTVNYRTTVDGVDGYRARSIWANSPLSIAANQIGPIGMGVFPDHHEYLPGIYSVSSTKKVMFSQGLLNYVPGTHIYAFNQTQYDTFAYNRTDFNNFVTYTDAVSDSLAHYMGMDDHHWKVLSADEWRYLLFTRDVEFHRYALATVNGRCGLMLFPDAFTWPSSVTNQPAILDGSAMYTNASYTVAQWSLLEEAGCVFLPAGGYLKTNGGYDNKTEGHYWTTDAQGSRVYFLFFKASSNHSVTVEDYTTHNNGHYTRLVYEVESVAK